MAAELKEHLDLDAKLIASHGGVFEVTADGKTIFSKKSVGRFPHEGEVLGQLKQRGTP